MNRLFELGNYRNRYFVMRHGHSEANRRGIIVSDPQNGIETFGLSEQGRAEVEDSLRRHGRLDADCRIVSSDFLRALETAETARRSLGCAHPVVTDPRLRERYFGDFEMQPNDAYACIWEQDRLNPDSERERVESANRVMQRVTSLVVDLERDFDSETFLLVSHGDAIQILQTAFAGRDAALHRDLEHLETAEIRELTAPLS